MPDPAALAEPDVALAPAAEPATGSESAAAPDDVLARALQSDPALRGKPPFAAVTTTEAPGWRFVTATIQRPDGSDPGHCPDLDGEVRARLCAADGGWQVVRSGTCSGDIYWLGRPALAGAPASRVGLSKADVTRSAWVRETSANVPALRSGPGLATDVYRLSRRIAAWRR